MQNQIKYTLRPVGYAFVELEDGGKGKMYVLGLFDENDNQAVEQVGDKQVPIIVKTEVMRVVEQKENIIKLPERKLILQ